MYSFICAVFEKIIRDLLETYIVLQNTNETEQVFEYRSCYSITLCMERWSE